MVEGLRRNQPRTALTIPPKVAESPDHRAPPTHRYMSSSSELHVLVPIPFLGLSSTRGLFDCGWRTQKRQL